MPRVAYTDRLLDNIERLRRAEREPSAARADIAAVRLDLAQQLGPTVSRARAARALGVSQTALDRWITSRRSFETERMGSQSPMTSVLRSSRS